MENSEEQKDSPTKGNVTDNAAGAPFADSGDQDFLTRVSPRSSLEPYLHAMFPVMVEQQRTISIVFMDLDRFKRFNDTYGHQFGDEILKYVGSSLRLTFQGVPCRIFRYGGDEFLIVFPDRPPRETVRLVQTLRHNMVYRPLIFKGKFHRVTASFGVANYPADGDTLEAVIKKADQALYTSKILGRNTVSLANEIKQRKVLRILTIILGLGTVLAVGTVVLPLLDRSAVSILKVFGVKVTPDMRDLDSVTLKDGSVLRGVIENETYVGMTMVTKIKDMPVNMYLDKSTVVDKSYGRKTLSKKRFEDFVNHNPNPHEE